MPNTGKQSINSDPETLAVDIGGTGVKMMLLSSKGKPLTDRLREPTPVPATPEAVLALLDQLKQKMPKFDRVSVGFPGVVKQGKTLTAHNLDPKWKGFDLRQYLEERWGRPVRVCNDAAVQGYGAIKGKGVELVLDVRNRARVVCCSLTAIFARVSNWRTIHGAKGKTYEE